jgi:hypothetical protein
MYDSLHAEGALTEPERRLFDIYQTMHASLERILKVHQ